MSERYDCDGCGELIGGAGDTMVRVNATFWRPAVKLQYGYVTSPVGGHRAHFHDWGCVVKWAENSGVSPLQRQPEGAS